MRPEQSTAFLQSSLGLMLSCRLTAVIHICLQQAFGSLPRPTLQSQGHGTWEDWEIQYGMRRDSAHETQPRYPGALRPSCSRAWRANLLLQLLSSVLLDSSAWPGIADEWRRGI